MITSIVDCIVETLMTIEGVLTFLIIKFISIEIKTVDLIFFYKLIGL
jgi:hypothetical protein